jgi:hypothetical protein
LNEPSSPDEDLPLADIIPAGERPIERSRLGAALPKIILDLFIVFAGVYAAFSLENFRESREQNHRREAVCRALDHELGQMAETKGPTYQREATTELRDWDQAISRGDKPLPPSFRIAGAERPPTSVWDATVSTNGIELIDPDLFFELARFYNRAKSVGDLYQRYAIGAQNDIWPRLQEGTQAFWTPDGHLRPEVATDVQRLRDFRDRQAELGKEARELRVKLQNSCRS